MLNLQSLQLNVLGVLYNSQQLSLLLALHHAQKDGNTSTTATWLLLMALLYVLIGPKKALKVTYTLFGLCLCPMMQLKLPLHLLAGDRPLQYLVPQRTLSLVAHWPVLSVLALSKM